MRCIIVVVASHRAPASSLRRSLLLLDAPHATHARPGSACGRLRRPCTQAPVAPVRGSCTRVARAPPLGGLAQGLANHGHKYAPGAENNQPTTQVRPPGRKRCCVPKRTQRRRRRSSIDGAQQHWAFAPATGWPPCSSHASVAHTATRPRHKAPPQSCALTTNAASTNAYPESAAIGFARAFSPVFCCASKNHYSASWEPSVSFSSSSSQRRRQRNRLFSSTCCPFLD